MKNKLINIFVKELGEPDSMEFLNEYLDFTLNYSKKGNGYSERHHILPRSSFKEYESEDWNIVDLLYEDHVYAHELLFQAYINRQNQRPLQFMKSQLSKNHEMVSESAKKGWKTLKSDPIKYSDWIRKQSNHMKSLSSEEQSRRSKLGWDRLNDIEYEKRCEINKNNWTDERKSKKSKDMKDYFKNNPDEMSKRSSKMWNNMDPSKKKEFDNKMDIVNKDPEKRAKAARSIKSKWKDPEFRNKMKNRKTSSRKVTAISPDGIVHEFEGLISMIEEYNFNRSLINKFRNTGKPVESENVKNKKSMSNTIGWIFNYTKYGETDIS